LTVPKATGLETYGENLEGRYSLSDPPRAYEYLRRLSKEPAVKRVKSQVAERQEPARIAEVLSEQSAGEVSSIISAIITSRMCYN
jgi:hypothetical protein